MQRGRVEAMFGAAYQVRRAVQRDARDRTRAYWAATRGRGNPFVIGERDGRLVFEAALRPATELVPTSPTTFVVVDRGTRVRLEPDGSLVLEDVNRSPQPAPRLGDVKLPLLELAAGRFDDAVALVKQLATVDPKDPAVDEDALNLLGYEIMRDDPARALLLLRMIAAAVPDSSNAHDSVAEAYMLAGDKAHAIAHYELAIATLAADRRIPAAEKPGRRGHAETVLAKLRAP